MKLKFDTHVTFFVILMFLFTAWMLSVVPLTENLRYVGFVIWGLLFFVWFFSCDIVRPGEEIIAYDYCMYEKRRMPVVKRKGLGEVCAGCNATWR